MLERVPACSLNMLIPRARGAYQLHSQTSIVGNTTWDPTIYQYNLTRDDFEIFWNISGKEIDFGLKVGERA